MYDADFSDSLIVTNQVSGIFYEGSDNIIAGKLLDKEITINIVGTSSQGQIEKTIKIPSRSNSIPLEGDHLTSYLERLWAFLTVKKLLQESGENKINMVVIKSQTTSKKFPGNTTKMSRQELAEKIAYKYNFLTNLTSFIITKDSITDDNILKNGPYMKDRAERLVSEYIPSVGPKSLQGSFDYEDPSACVGTLELFSQTYLRGQTLLIKYSKPNLGLSDLNEFAERITSLRITGNDFKICKIVKNIFEKRIKIDIDKKVFFACLSSFHFQTVTT
jgi:hypothetical protein